jgi:hypothetical protein
LTTTDEHRFLRAAGARKRIANASKYAQKRWYMQANGTIFHAKIIYLQ